MIFLHPFLHVSTKMVEVFDAMKQLSYDLNHDVPLQILANCQIYKENIITNAQSSNVILLFHVSLAPTVQEIGNC